MPPRPLVFGPALPDADATTDWRSFQTKARQAPALVVHVVSQARTLPHAAGIKRRVVVDAGSTLSAELQQIILRVR